MPDKIKDRDIKFEYNINNVKDILIIGENLKKIKKYVFKLLNENYLKEDFANEIESLKHNIKEFKRFKKSLNRYLDISKVEELREEEAEEIEYIIENKKVKKILGILSFTTKKYKKTINKINDLLKNKKSKIDYKETANNIKNYIVYKNEIENNQKYKDYFSNLFEGTKTSIGNVKRIEKLHTWLLGIEEKLKNKNLIKIIVSQDEELFETIIQNIDELKSYFDKFEKNIDELKLATNAEYISHLFNKIDDIDFISLKNSLEQISNYIHLVIKKVEEIRSNEENAVNVLLKENYFQDLRGLVKKCGCTNANIYKNVDELEKYADRDYIQNDNISFTEKFYQDLKEKEEILDELEEIDVDEKIKEWVLEKKDDLAFLDDYKDLVEEAKNNEKVEDDIDNTINVEKEDVEEENGKFETQNEKDGKEDLPQYAEEDLKEKNDIIETSMEIEEQDNDSDSDGVEDKENIDNNTDNIDIDITTDLAEVDNIKKVENVSLNETDNNEKNNINNYTNISFEENNSNLQKGEKVANLEKINSLTEGGNDKEIISKNILKIYGVKIEPEEIPDNTAEFSKLVDRLEEEKAQKEAQEGKQEQEQEKKETENNNNKEGGETEEEKEDNNEKEEEEGKQEADVNNNINKNKGEENMTNKTVEIKNLVITEGSFSFNKKGNCIEINLNDNDIVLELADDSITIKNLKITNDNSSVSFNKNEITIKINNNALTLELTD